MEPSVAELAQLIGGGSVSVLAISVLYLIQKWRTEHREDMRALIANDEKQTVILAKLEERTRDVDLVASPQTHRRRTPSYTANYECRSGEVYVLACGPGTVWAVHPTDAHGISLEIDHHQVPGVGPRVSAYRHLDRCYVKAKDEVKAGQVIGIVGYDKTAPASQTPNHLHFELWDPSKQRIPGTDSRVAWGLDPAPVMALWGYRHREGGESTPPPQTDGQTDGAPPDSGLLTVAVLGVGAKVLLF
jgi:hypothetical protein